jgi:hypothetical protein
VDGEEILEPKRREAEIHPPVDLVHKGHDVAASPLF